MEFKSLASSSHGNAYIVEDEQTRILLECGVSHKQLQKLAGFSLSDIKACLVSHEHKDHAKCVDELIKRGVVGQYDGYDVKSTNNVYRDGTHVYCIVRSDKAIAFAGQINEVEAGRMEKRFSDYVRGLDTYGAKIISQDELECVKIPL